MKIRSYIDPLEGSFNPTADLLGDSALTILMKVASNSDSEFESCIYIRGYHTPYHT